MIASDRISAFDHVLPEGIPYKGQVLNQIAAKFLKATEDIVPNGTKIPKLICRKGSSRSKALMWCSKRSKIS